MGVTEPSRSADTERTEFDRQQRGNRKYQNKEGLRNPDGREFECFRTNEVFEVFMSSNSISALRLGSVIHTGGLFFYLATHRKRRGTFYGVPRPFRG